MTNTDREYILKQDAIDACLNGWNKDYKEIVIDIKQLEGVTIPTSPCDLCKYNPPSSTDGKPCTMCPAVKMD